MLNWRHERNFKPMQHFARKISSFFTKQWKAWTYNRGTSAPLPLLNLIVLLLGENEGLQSHTGSVNACFRVIYPMGLQRGTAEDCPVLSASKLFLTLPRYDTRDRRKESLCCQRSLWSHLPRAMLY